MDDIQYDPEWILYGFTEDFLKELAKKLKRRIWQTKSDIIQEILSPSKGKMDDNIKVWQEINRHLRKELEAISQEAFMMFSSGDAPLAEQFKVGYMFTLSTNPEIRSMGKKLYCQAEEAKKLEEDIEEAVAVTLIDNLTEIETREAEETIEAEETKETIEAEETKEIREAEGLTKARGKKEIKDSVIEASRVKTFSEERGTEETEELQKRVRTLENKLRKANSEVLSNKGQLEKLKQNMIALKSQWVKEKEETGKFRNRVRELEGERAEKEKEIDILKQKLEQKKTLAPQKTKEQSQPGNLKDNESCDEIDLASYQGRKALIFAERDNEVDIRLNALGIIPIWAMEIDWNRPRRRMSTCEIVLYKRNDEKHKKLNEIRDIAKYWNIPCGELLSISGRIIRD